MSLVIREIQITTMMRYHLTPVRWLKWTTQETKGVGEDVKKGGPSCTVWVGAQAGAAALENSIEGPQEVTNRTTLWSSSCTLGIYPKDTKILIQKANEPQYL